MWRYAFLNLCFVLLLITLLSIQHSATVFGPGRDQWERCVLQWTVNICAEFTGCQRRSAARQRFLNDTWRRESFLTNG
mgnify:CR=1 FL=1